jgi:FKBP-type peptidyl-prolyl cis-trans isomerase FkpA
MKKMFLLVTSVALTLSLPTATAQKKTAPTKAKATTTKTTTSAGGYTTLPSGLQYKFITRGKGTRKPKVGDHIEMHIHVSVNDSIMFDSRKMNANKPVPLVVQPASFKGDPIEGFTLMVPGDSILLQLPVDSIIKQGKQMMPGMKAGDMLKYQVVLVSAMTDEEFKKDQDTKQSAQKSIDESLIAAYLKSNNINAKRTASGLYYNITKPGKGDDAKPGETVVVNYTGKLLGSDKAFDSNTDPEFKHTDPFSVVLGSGGVIKGWEEGLALLKSGSKATFYIPSGLAYGSQDRSPAIPANSILVFDIEVLSVGSQKIIDDKLITDYLQKNNIKAQKTPSGLYYTIKSEGTGDKPKVGDKVSVKYNGTFLDGKKFDGNMDRPDPFQFTLGQGMVIRGWDEGIALLKKGSKATLFIPSEIGYGARGGGPIPPNAVLLFDVELVDFQKP